jgi:hypothetical protein
MMKRNAFTFVEALVVLAILATLIGLLAPAFMAARDAANRSAASQPEKPREPPESIWLSTVKHDGHWFIVRSDSWGMHHPDCPCHSRTPEAAE